MVFRLKSLSLKNLKNGYQEIILFLCGYCCETMCKSSIWSNLFNLGVHQCKCWVKKARIFDKKVTEITITEIRVTKIKATKIGTTKIRIASNHRELHEAIFVLVSVQIMDSFKILQMDGFAAFCCFTVHHRRQIKMQYSCSHVFVDAFYDQYIFAHQAFATHTLLVQLSQWSSQPVMMCSHHQLGNKKLKSSKMRSTSTLCSNRLKSMSKLQSQSMQLTWMSPNVKTASVCNK